MIITKIKFNGARVRLGGFGMQKYQMLQLGNAGAQVVKDRTARGIGSDDAPMPGLKKGYAIQKSKAGHGNRRNLRFTGDMIDNLACRYADERQAKINFSTRHARQAAQANERRTPFIQWSGQDVAILVRAAETIFKANVEDLRLRIIGGGRRINTGWSRLIDTKAA